MGLLLFNDGAALAYHSFAAEYDANKPVTLKGIITKVEWMNPHILFFIDVKDEKSNGSPMTAAAKITERFRRVNLRHVRQRRCQPSMSQPYRLCRLIASTGPSGRARGQV